MTGALRTGRIRTVEVPPPPLFSPMNCQNQNTLPSNGGNENHRFLRIFLKDGVQAKNVVVPHKF